MDPTGPATLTITIKSRAVLDGQRVRVAAAQTLPQLLGLLGTVAGFEHASALHIVTAGRAGAALRSTAEIREGDELFVAQQHPRPVRFNRTDLLV